MRIYLVEYNGKKAVIAEENGYAKLIDTVWEGVNFDKLAERVRAIEKVRKFKEYRQECILDNKTDWEEIFKTVYDRYEDVTPRG